MKTDTSKNIIRYISEHKQATPKELVVEFDISEQAIHKQLKNLIENGALVKSGTPPKVYYSLSESGEAGKTLDGLNVDRKIINTIDKNYLIITPAGEMKTGWEGFAYWTQKNHLDITKTAVEYIKTLEKYLKYTKNGLISGIDKLRTSFEQVNVDNLYYLDFYSIERFGKTRLGQLLLYSKQSQNRELIDDLVDSIKPQIMKLIHDKNVDGVAFVQPTVKRELQFMKELEKELNLHIRTIGIVKIKTQVIVPQKTLNKLEDRIENARKTFVVEDNSKYKNILIIDDAVGSGATINEIAGKMREKHLTNGKIIGLAITGSFKGFDVISEV
ncbi:MAG: winged helix-turn-helix transcriptional regulator [bacterium]